MARYSEESALIENNDSFFGATVEREEVSNRDIKRINETLEDKNDPSIRVESDCIRGMTKMREGVLVKLKYGSGYNVDYNKTPYRVYGVKIYDCYPDKYKSDFLIKNVFLEPFSNRANSVRLVFLFPRGDVQDSPHINSSCYLSKKETQEHYKSVSKERSIKSSFEDSNKNFGSVKVISDRVISEVYDFDTKNLVKLMI